MEFVKSRNQYIDAILYDSNKDVDDLENFLKNKCGVNVQTLGFVFAEYLADGTELPVLDGMINPTTTIFSFYLVGKKKEIISVPLGHYITFNGKTIKVVAAYDFEKEWDKVNENESQYALGSDNEEA